ncbi:MAG: hypothetical protein SWH61_08245 [Thermodesulfobacteriota bacterium]|nr:hypothetical protein [Thermodesulfobacteriota bacterium]
MKQKVVIFICVLSIATLFSCGSEDDKRVKALNDMPVLWESALVIADPDMPGMRHFVTMFDSYDATLARAWTEDKFTEDYIPEAVMAFNAKSYRNKPRTITIKMGDTLSVLEKKKNNTGREVCLVRTADNTYAWLYAFHLLDENGNRIGRFEE